MHSALGAYGFPPDQSVLFAQELVQGEEIFRSSDRRLIAEKGKLKIWLLDRQVTGQDWMRGPFQRKSRHPRVTFFGIKGGVGRSTVLVIWAWKLAKQGKKVLVFDLDLESPGVSSTLMPPSHQPDFGIVDWFVEDGVGQAEVVEGEMMAPSPLSQGLGGEIRVVPAFGSKTGDYLPKLARCYNELSGNDYVSWGERVRKMIENMEKQVRPDVVFLDSRAGIHDISAVLVTRMDAENLLFAVDSPQTWAAYAFLFKHWRDHPNRDSFRSSLQIVAGMVPETQREEHLKRFQQNSWDLFRDNLYDYADSTYSDAFSFDLADQEAPHSPLPVFWHRALQEFNPIKSLTGLDEKTVDEALGTFMAEAKKLVFSAKS
jgi:hypothetical protein